MYIIFGSKKDVYESIPLDGIEIVEKYLYKFYNEVKLELNIAAAIIWLIILWDSVQYQLLLGVHIMITVHFDNTLHLSVVMLP